MSRPNIATRRWNSIFFWSRLFDFFGVRCLFKSISHRASDCLWSGVGPRQRSLQIWSITTGDTFHPIPTGLEGIRTSVVAVPLNTLFFYPGEILMPTESDTCISCRSCISRQHMRTITDGVMDFRLQIHYINPSFLSVYMERGCSCQSSFFSTGRAAEICLGQAPKCRKIMGKVGERGKGPDGGSLLHMRVDIILVLSHAARGKRRKL